MSDPVRIFVGCDGNDADLESMAVFHMTLDRHCSRPYELRWMRMNHDKGSPWRISKWATAKWSTPFTGTRWSVPSACGYEGRGIYCDVDQWWQRDPAELWDTPMHGKVLLNKSNQGKVGFSVTVFDCALAKAHIQSKPSDPGFHDANLKYFRAHPELVATWDSDVVDWNVIDGGNFTSLEDPRIGLVHYSRMGHQPSHEFSLPRLAAEGAKHWYDGKIEPHPRQDMREKFAKLLRQAIESGFTLDRYRRRGEPVRFSKKSYRGK